MAPAASTADTILKAHRIYGAIGRPSPFRTSASGQLHVPGSARELTKADADEFLAKAEDARHAAILEAAELFVGLSDQQQEAALVLGELYVMSNHADPKVFVDSVSTMRGDRAEILACKRARLPLVELKEAFVCGCKSCSS